MVAIGRVLCKCVLEEMPIGRGLGQFVFDFLADAHERRVFSDVRLALSALADFDPDLAQRWAQLLVEPAPFLTLDYFDPNADGEELDATTADMERAVLAGCRSKLLTCREASLRALRAGFIETVDLQVQLGALTAAELLRMMRGNTELSRDELLKCFQWPDLPGATVGMQEHAGFAQVGSDCPRFLREVILDDSTENGLSNAERLHLLEWCTALTALPCNGLKEPILLKHYPERGANDLPNVHTCTQEVHLPPYESREQLRSKLLKAVEHRHDGFQIE